MAIPDLLPSRLPATSRWAIHAALLVMVVLAVVLVTLLSGIVDLGPESGPDVAGWTWRWR